MVSVGSQQTIVSGVNTQVVLNGNYFALVKSFSIKWGNKQEEEKVTGTDLPTVTTEAFHGEGDMEVLYSTEDTVALEQFSRLITPTAGQTPTVSFQWIAKDVQGNAITYSTQVTPETVEFIVRGPSIVVAKLHFIVLGQHPAVTSGGPPPLPQPPVGNCIGFIEWVSVQGVAPPIPPWATADQKEWTYYSARGVWFQQFSPLEQANRLEIIEINRGIWIPHGYYGGEEPKRAEFGGFNDLGSPDQPRRAEVLIYHNP